MAQASVARARRSGAVALDPEDGNIFGEAADCRRPGRPRARPHRLREEMRAGARWGPQVAPTQRDIFLVPPPTAARARQALRDSSTTCRTVGAEMLVLAHAPASEAVPADPAHVSAVGQFSSKGTGSGTAEWKGHTHRIEMDMDMTIDMDMGPHMDTRGASALAARGVHLGEDGGEGGDERLDEVGGQLAHEQTAAVGVGVGSK